MPRITGNQTPAPAVIPLPISALLGVSSASPSHDGEPMKEYPQTSRTKATSSARRKPTRSAMVPETMGKK